MTNSQSPVDGIISPRLPTDLDMHGTTQELGRGKEIYESQGDQWLRGSKFRENGINYGQYKCYFDEWHYLYYMIAIFSK